MVPYSETHYSERNQCQWLQKQVSPVEIWQLIAGIACLRNFVFLIFFGLSPYVSLLDLILCVVFSRFLLEL